MTSGSEANVRIRSSASATVAPGCPCAGARLLVAIAPRQRHDLVGTRRRAAGLRLSLLLGARPLDPLGVVIGPPAENAPQLQDQHDRDNQRNQCEKIDLSVHLGCFPGLGPKRVAHET